MEALKPYYHTVQYYETDAMAVVHHSNYIRWFEEARLDYLEQSGYPYDGIEQRATARQQASDLRGKHRQLARPRGVHSRRSH